MALGRPGTGAPPGVCDGVDDDDDEPKMPFTLPNMLFGLPAGFQERQ